MADDESSRPSRRGIKLPKRSSMWQHFEETDSNDGSVKCKYCCQKFGPKSGGNLKRHYEKQCRNRPDAAVPLERQNAMEVDEEAVATVRAPAQPLPRAVPSEDDQGTDDSWQRFSTETAAAAAVRAPPPLPSPTLHYSPSGSDGSSDSEPDLDEAIEDLARMIALGGHDPSILEDDYFRSFVRRLNPGFHLPSRRDVENMCDVIFDQATKDEETRLSNIQVRPSVTVGKAKTIDGEVLYTACHFIDDQWSLHKMVFDASVIVPDPPLRGPLLGVREVGLAYRGSDLSVDNVIYNAVIPTKKFRYGIFMTICGLSNELWINECMKNKFSEYSELFCTAYMDNVLHSIAQCLSSFPHIRDVHNTVSEHEMTRQEREKLLSDRGLKNLWAYSEPWYSCYCSLQVLRTKASATPTYIEYMLCKLWGAIYSAIRTISTSRSPTSHLCLRELFYVWESFQSEQETAHKANDDSTERALKDAENTLNRALRDYSLVWSIPLVLDPRKKLQSVELILERVFGHRLIIITEIKKLYGFYLSFDDDNAMAVGDAEPSQQASYGQRNAQAKAELDSYLEDDQVPDTEGFDILNWWKENSHKYPRVARMARDALAMPTCSKLSSEQVAQVRSILRGYSRSEYYYYGGPY